MSEFIICTDSACDIKPETLQTWGAPFRSLTFRFEGEDTEYSNHDMDITAFYNKMREGGVAKTAAVNVEAFVNLFEELLKQEKDILYLGFSSGLSTTYNSARLAAEQLRPAFPERKIVVIDTLCASAGEGLVIYLALQHKKNGAFIEETADFVRELLPKLCHWFTVDDLVYLKRGGRISPTAAFVGNMLGIKPVLHVDDEGHLINVSKVRGRKTAVAALADQYGQLALDKANGTVFISHSDCLKDAQELANILKTRHGVEVQVITDVGPVIGAHSGPGTLALFFVGDHR
ncbi:MAG: DegV family protein [Clostridia bacterium]|nr:DegV family protein [Clostridia bacterium]